MGSLSIWHWLVVAGVIMIFFGRGKITELMGDVASGIKAFKKGMAEDDDVKKAEDDKKKLEDVVSTATDTAKSAASSTKTN